ncbi:hypothetical protein GWK47_028318 [Chionoecetes opilio]|uniref:Uncharacterized protein n=1 Tax=Chionoecetes opilio TaxID=41210 RepID=A0A8J4Z512_CHIOP|nr:hypothetical protein GWK47_028318 [Chionoecetes opilio]
MSRGEKTPARGKRLSLFCDLGAQLPPKGTEMGQAPFTLGGKEVTAAGGREGPDYPYARGGPLDDQDTLRSGDFRSFDGGEVVGSPPDPGHNLPRTPLEKWPAQKGGDPSHKGSISPWLWARPTPPCPALGATVGHSPNTCRSPVRVQGQRAHPRRQKHHLHPGPFVFSRAGATGGPGLRTETFKKPARSSC